MSDEILILGGGFAGLAAGVALSGAGRRVRLLEQKPHLGGRARSFREATTGAIVDNGQHIFMGCYHATRRFLQEIGTLDRIVFQPRLRVDFLDPPGRLSCLECPELPAPLHLLAGVLRSDSFSAREKFEVLRLGRALGSARASEDEMEGQTVEAWLGRQGQSEGVRRKFWDLLCIAALNENPRRASGRLFARVLRLALFKSPEDSRLGYARVGLSECYTEAASEYIKRRGGTVECGHAVMGLVIENGLCRGVTLSSGERIQAECVLSTVPWFELVRILPGERLRAERFFTNILSLRPAPIISINLWFDQPVTDLDFVGLRDTTIQWLFNKGKLLGSGQHYVSIVLSGAHEHVGRSKEDLADTAVRELGELLPATREAKLVHSLVIKERFATFSPAPEVEGLRPGAVTPIRGLFLAGDWTATGLPATIEGAVQSGYAAANEIAGSE